MAAQPGRNDAEQVPVRGSGGAARQPVGADQSGAEQLREVDHPDRLRLRRPGGVQRHQDHLPDRPVDQDRLRDGQALPSLPRLLRPLPRLGDLRAAYNQAKTLTVIVVSVPAACAVCLSTKGP